MNKKLSLLRLATRNRNKKVSNCCGSTLIERFTGNGKISYGWYCSVCLEDTIAVDEKDYFWDKSLQGNRVKDSIC